MKKILSLLLAAVTLLTLAACASAPAATAPAGTAPAGTEKAAATTAATAPAGTEKAAETEEEARKPVPGPMQTPDYAGMVGGDTSIAHLREIAVKAMRDELMIQWYPQKTFYYNKDGAVSWKTFYLYRRRTYLGLPYTSAGMGIYQFLEYYDQTTGEFSFTDSATFSTSIGNSCTSSPAWALFTVCTSMRGKCISNFVTIPNGFYPLGGVKYDPSVSDFKGYPTDRIIRENGEQKVAYGYSLAQPADLVVCDYSGDGHSMMVIEPAHVEYKANGEIDTAKSYLMIQDQRAGDYQVMENRVVMLMSGRSKYKATFAELLGSRYIAVTVAEFMGEKAYEKTAFTVSNELSGLDELVTATVSCNRPIAVARLVMTLEDGTEKLISRHLMTRYDVGSGYAFDLDCSKFLSNLKADRRVPKTGSFTLTLTCVAADGVTGSWSVPVTR